MHCMPLWRNLRSNKLDIKNTQRNRLCIVPIITRFGCRQSRLMPVEADLMLLNYTTDLSQPSLPEFQVTEHVVLSLVPKDSAKWHSTKGVQSPFWLAGSPGFSRVQQDREDNREILQLSSPCTSVGIAYSSCSEFTTFRAHCRRRLTSGLQPVGTLPR